MQPVTEFIIPPFVKGSTCFERYAAHHQELLMMSGVPVETCWAFNERWDNKFCYKVASCWLFLLNHTTMHGSMNIKFTKEYLPISVRCFLVLIFRLWSIPYRFPSPSPGVCFAKGAYLGYQSTLCQSFPTRLIYIIWKFSHSLLRPV